MDAFEIALGTILTQPEEGNIDYSISFASIKLSYWNKTITLQKEKD